MVFSSILFVFCFLPVFLILYYLTPSRWRNITLMAASILFYSWGGPVFIFVILLTTAADYLLVKQIEKSAVPGRKRAFLLLSLTMNLGLLFAFKYLWFFTSVLDGILVNFGAAPIAMQKIALPIGISFFTFESLTYVIDVYRGEARSLTSFRNYLTYIIMFPKLIAGPIIPYHSIAGQIESDRPTPADRRLAGLMRFILGLGKKVLIANVLGETVTDMYKLPVDQIGTVAAWAMSIGYTMQLYFDFSGYCDMAIGISSMMGFRIPENFNFPYISRSITEFWRRWHITLGNWMKNYLYIPLGGNKGSVFRTYLNLWLVFFISGLWHGAGWNYILWGLYHGFFLVIERLFLGRYLRSKWSVIYTFLIANIGWVIFRNEDLGTAGMLLGKMFSWSVSPQLPVMPFTPVLLIALLFAFSGLIPKHYQLVQDDEQLFLGGRRLSWLYPAVLVLFVLSASYLAGQDFNPFIYFRF